MVTSIESRLERLEAALVPADPEARMVVTIAWVKPDGPADPITGYSDGDGHTLEREEGELPETFQARAEAWVRMVHEHKDPLCCCVLFPV